MSYVMVGGVCTDATEGCSNPAGNRPSFHHAPCRTNRCTMMEVLVPLAHGVMAAFKVHQLCNGFNLRTTAVVEGLLDLTQRNARAIDIKWWGHSKALNA